MRENYYKHEGKYLNEEKKIKETIYEKIFLKK